jgi:hypothetical protein
MPDITGADLQGRTIKIESVQQLEGWACRVTFADTGDMITNIERIEIDIQATSITTAKVHLVHFDRPDLEGVQERAITTDVEISTLARVDEVIE